MTDHETNAPPLPPADQVRLQAAALADHLQRCGVQFLPKPDPQRVAQLQGDFAPEPSGTSAVAATDAATAPTLPGIEPTPTPPARPPATGTSIAPIEQPYPGTALPVATRAEQLNLLSQQVAACTRCEVLASCRTQTVFGEGHASPRVAFFGEGPGADEDRTGRPFVGKAGQLLTKMIEACSLAREDVYILNTVKCRPPGNRNPEPEELQNCREYFERQLEILRPEYIVCLGAVSSQALLRSKLSVGRLRGKFHRYFESKVLVTYHPAYLLRNPDAKKATWQDLQLMMRDAGIEVPGKR